MKHKINSSSSPILLLVVMVTGIVTMIASAFAAVSMYETNTDPFTRSLGSRLAVLCSDSDLGLSRTQLWMLECMDVKNMKYQTDDSGRKKFYAELRLIHPRINCGSYAGKEPAAYLSKAAQTMFDNKRHYSSVDIVGLCDGDTPVVDMETLQSIAQCANEAWDNGSSLTENKHIVQAVSDAFCPAPFKDRKYAPDSNAYTDTYRLFLTQCAGLFAEKGFSINGEETAESSAISTELNKTLTPYLCSVQDIQLSSSPAVSGILSLHFHALNVIQAISDAKSKASSAETFESEVLSAIASDVSGYAGEKSVTIDIDIDFADLMSNGYDKDSTNFKIIRANAEYYDGCRENVSVGVQALPQESKVIAGSSNGQWPVAFKRASGDGNAIINIIQIKEDGSESAVMKVFLTDGGEEMVALPRGRYRLNIAVGKDYYGAKGLFGSDGIYFKDNTVFDPSSADIPSVTVAKHEEESLSLLEYMIRKQQPDTTCIEQRDF